MIYLVGWDTTDGSNWAVFRNKRLALKWIAKLKRDQRYIDHSLTAHPTPKNKGEIVDLITRCQQIHGVYA